MLWRGLGINYAGGVLDHPARVAIHFTHRVGAVVAVDPAAARGVLALRGLGAGAALGRARRPRAPWRLQLSIGFFMVLRALPAGARGRT